MNFLKKIFSLGSKSKDLEQELNNNFEKEVTAKKYDLLISYSSKDKKIADAVCSILEKRGIRCWIAPRDITPGSEWASAITEAIPLCNIFVLIYSKASNESPQVMREVERAVHHGLTIIPFRLEDIVPSKSLEFFISSCHWLDALTKPVESHIDFLADSVLKLLNRPNSKNYEKSSVRINSQITIGERYSQMLDLGYLLSVIQFTNIDLNEPRNAVPKKDIENLIEKLGFENPKEKDGAEIVKYFRYIINSEYERNVLDIGVDFGMVMYFFYFIKSSNRSIEETEKISKELTKTISRFKQNLTALGILDQLNNNENYNTLNNLDKADYPDFDLIRKSIKTQLLISFSDKF